MAGLKPRWKGGNRRKLAVTERKELASRLQQMTVEQALSQEERGSSGPFWTIETVEKVVEKWYGVRYRSRESYRLLLGEAGFSFQRREGIYRSRPSDAVIAAFEADAEKK
jgi:transposase